MTRPVPHDLDLAELDDEPGLAVQLYQERFGFVRREHHPPRPVRRPEANPALARADRARTGR